VAPRDSVLVAIDVAEGNDWSNARGRFIEISNPGEDVQYWLGRDVWYGRATDVLNVEKMISEGRDNSGSL